MSAAQWSRPDMPSMLLLSLADQADVMLADWSAQVNVEYDWSARGDVIRDEYELRSADIDLQLLEIKVIMLALYSYI